MGATRVTAEHVFKMMRKHQIKFWKLFEKDASNIDEMQDDNVNLEDSILQLQNVLDDLSGNTVNIAVSEWNNKRQAKGGRPKYNYEFCILLRNDGAGSTARQDAGAGGGNMALLKEVQDLKIKLMKLELQKENEVAIEKLREELGGNKKDKKLSPADRMLEEFMPYMKMYMKKEMGLGDDGSTTTKAINGPPPDEKAMDFKLVKDAELKRISEALMTWRNADKDYISALEVVANWAASNPTEYRQYLPMLKGS